MRVLAFASELLSLEIVGNLSLFLLFRFCFWFSLNRFLFDSNFYTMKFSMFSAFPSPAFTLPSRPRPLPGELFYCIACLSVCQALFFAFFYLFCSSLAPLRQLCYIIKFTPACQSFYLSFSSLFLIIFLSSLKALKTSYVTPFLSIKILVPRSHSVIINGIFSSFTISHEGCTTSTPISS